MGGMGGPRKKPRRAQGKRGATRSPDSVKNKSPGHEDTLSDLSLVSPMPPLDVSYTAYLTPDVLTPSTLPHVPPRHKQQQKQQQEYHHEHQQQPQQQEYHYHQQPQPQQPQPQSSYHDPSHSRAGSHMVSHHAHPYCPDQLKKDTHHPQQLQRDTHHPHKITYHPQHPHHDLHPHPPDPTTPLTYDDEEEEMYVQHNPLYWLMYHAARRDPTSQDPPSDPAQYHSTHSSELPQYHKHPEPSQVSKPPPYTATHKPSSEPPQYPPPKPPHKKSRPPQYPPPPIPTQSPEEPLSMPHRPTVKPPGSPIPTHYQPAERRRGREASPHPSRHSTLSPRSSRSPLTPSTSPSRSQTSSRRGSASPPRHTSPLRLTAYPPRRSSTSPPRRSTTSPSRRSTTSPSRSSTHSSRSTRSPHRSTTSPSRSKSHPPKLSAVPPHIAGPIPQAFHVIKPTPILTHAQIHIPVPHSRLSTYPQPPRHDAHTQTPQEHPNYASIEIHPRTEQSYPQQEDPHYAVLDFHAFKPYPMPKVVDDHDHPHYATIDFHPRQPLPQLIKDIYSYPQHPHVQEERQLESPPQQTSHQTSPDEDKILSQFTPYPPSPPHSHVEKRHPHSFPHKHPHQFEARHPNLHLEEISHTHYHPKETRSHFPKPKPRQPQYATIHIRPYPRHPDAQEPTHVHPRPKLQAQARPKPPRTQVQIPIRPNVQNSSVRPNNQHHPHLRHPLLDRPKSASGLQLRPRFPIAQTRFPVVQLRPRSETLVNGRVRHVRPVFAQPRPNFHHYHQLIRNGFPPARPRLPTKYRVVGAKRNWRSLSNIRIFELCDDARFVYIVHTLIQVLLGIEQDLQSEIESHKDVLASLNATGQKLLGTLDNQEEAVMLQRRLHEMNQRWNTLKHKSIAIRNRLEGNSENWNSLLLSLRELIEWVIRKDTELTSLGPAVGDLPSLAKFADDLASFRRVIDEKQPVIESNLKSGRQLIASEPPLSDTSDSEAGRELDNDQRYRGGEEAAREVTRAVRREVSKLSDKWAGLRERAASHAAQADLTHKKLGVLQKTVEDVSGRLAEAERNVESWGSLPQDPNLADQHAHNVRKVRETLMDLQRGVDDVNDQAARFSAHNVPLTPANSARLHDLNNRWKILESCVNERWRAVAGRSREVTPLTPAQLASSVAPPWERATTPSKVPYYINHDQESTHWDHPAMMELLDSLTEFNHIKFSAYRTATKLRLLQKKLALDRAKMQTATDIFDEHGLRGQNDRLIDVSDMLVVLSALYATIADENSDVDITLAMDLCLNWLLNVYDSQRTGQMRVLSFKIGLVCLCMGHLEEKYRYMFRLIADPNRLADQRKLGLLLHDCVQVPRQLGEVAAFGGSNIEPSVRSCFTKAGKDRETIEAVHFLAWVQQEPQSLVWLAVLHRVAASETIQHQVKCNICKAYPIVGLRYRCLKCLSFDMCQRCFFDGRSGKSHKITHPMHEYCTATTAGENVKDFTKALKNKFKSKRSLQKHTKKGYLPVQTVLEGDPLESPSPSPQHNVTSQDMHSRLELYASRLAEVELRTNSNSTPDSEDEHGLIAQYCQSLSSSDAPLPVPRSPLQVMAAVDAEQKDELEQMIRALEEENGVLQAEYDRLKSQQPVGSPPDDGPGGGGIQRSEAEMIAEAKLLRQHKGRLEARMGILEEHNRQLEAQLHRLRHLLGEPGGMSSPNKSGTLQTKSVTASQLAMDSPAKVNGHSTQGELGKVVGTLVATMTHEQENDWHSQQQQQQQGEQEDSDSDEDDEDEERNV